MPCVELPYTMSVSYTHLDVYKRQGLGCVMRAVYKLDKLLALTLFAICFVFPDAVFQGLTVSSRIHGISSRPSHNKKWVLSLTEDGSHDYTKP